MPYAWPVEGGEPIRVVGSNVVLPTMTVSEAWVAGLADGEAEAMGFVWVDDDPAEIEAVRAVVVAGIKDEARARIVGRYSLEQQANMNMRATELVDTRLEREWTEDEAAERVVLKAAAAWIKSVRTASDEIEAALPETIDELRALDIGAHPAWPAA